MTRSRSWPANIAKLIVTYIFYFARAGLAVDCSVPDARFNVSEGSYFSVTMDGISSFDVQTSINYWSSCQAYGTGMPTFEFGAAGGIPVRVVRIDGRSPQERGGTCGVTSYGSMGVIASATVTVWTQDQNGNTCDPIDSLAHEFGHVLGLADVGDLSCSGHIMGRAFGDGSRRTVSGDDCAMADGMWSTRSEEFYDPYCEAYCPTYCTGSTCEGHPSPILIDLENDGIHLTGLDDPVWFDIDADGALDLLSWTDRSEGFLALDRNGNGTIDNGGELFGNVTRLANGSLPLNGYQALADLDSWVFSGNGDGHLDAADPAFSSLLLWSDRNHDGISQPDELQTVDQAGVRRIDLGYRRSRRTDRYGNIFAFAGRAWKEGPHGSVDPIVTWDVFFSKVP
jgi:hypothetical protein